MYAIASFNDNDESVITTFKPAKNKLKLVDSVTLSKDYSNTMTLDVTKNNIFYSRLASSQHNKKHYRYDNKFYRL